MIDALDTALLLQLTALEDGLEAQLAAALERWDQALAVDGEQPLAATVAASLYAAQGAGIEAQRKRWAMLETKSLETFQAERVVWARQRGAELVVAITDDQRRRIAAIVERGAAEGLGARQIRAEISRLIEGIGGLTPLDRAQRIARTELHRAATWAQQREAETLARAGADLVKVWTATLDKRTRPSHRLANGQVRELRELFRVGSAQLERPGDPRGPAHETIQCRCVARYLPRTMVRDDRTRRAQAIARERTEPGVRLDILAREAVELDDLLAAAVIRAAAQVAVAGGRALAVPRLADNTAPPALTRVTGFRRLTGQGDGPAAFLTSPESDAAWADLIKPWRRRTSPPTAPEPAGPTQPAPPDRSEFAALVELAAKQGAAVPNGLALIGGPYADLAQYITNAQRYVTARGKVRGHEYLTAWRSAGGPSPAITEYDGLPGRVSLPRKIKDSWMAEGLARTYHIAHNHPQSSPLSGPDLVVAIGYTNVASIWAFGHEGTVYAVKVISSTKPVGVVRVVNEWQNAFYARVQAMFPGAPNGWLALLHAQALALERAGVIEYHFDHALRGWMFAQEAGRIELAVVAMTKEIRSALSAKAATDLRRPAALIDAPTHLSTADLRQELAAALAAGMPAGGEYCGSIALELRRRDMQSAV